MVVLSTRFAPTPSGFLHEGNAFSFVLTWLVARHFGGTIHLRIDDLDQTRCRSEYVEDIFRSLDWLGLDWDSGPQGVDDFYKNFSQQHHLAEYQQALTALQTGGHLFACICSRKQILAAHPSGHYAGTCRGAGHAFSLSDAAWRIRTPVRFPAYREWLPENHSVLADKTEIRDFVVRRRDGLPAYQIASVVDDIRLGINFIVRGEDLRPSTQAQVFWAGLVPAYQAFTDTIFWHHSLLLDVSGAKLSKSAGAASLKTQRESGQASAELYQRFSALLGFPPGRQAQDLKISFGQFFSRPPFFK